MTKLIQQFAVQFNYEVHFTAAIFDRENSLLANCLKKEAGDNPSKVLIVVDDGVDHHHPNLKQEISGYFNHFHAELRLVCPPLVIQGGEACKNDESIIDQLLEAINDYGVDRHAYVIAIGGGSILDTVGFAAAIAHRGIRHVRIPTTVLAQNDAGIGVKNGINKFGKKNFIGCFDPPYAVINDVNFLTSLDDRDWRAGIAEAIKVALIKDAELFEFIWNNAPKLVERDKEVMQEVIIECAKLHLEHISGGDPFEKGSSRPLDFGHWAAHKLEQLTQFKVRHGEAVAIGIALDCVYATEIGMLSEEELDRVTRLFMDLGFSLFHPMLKHNIDDKESSNYLLAGLEEFREHLGGELTITLIEAIGKGKEVHHIDEENMKLAISKLESLTNLTNHTN